MTTPQQPSGPAVRSATPASGHVRDVVVDHTAAVQDRGLPCGGFVVGLLTGATTVAWLLLAAALTADTQPMPCEPPHRTDCDGAPMTPYGTQRNEPRTSGFRGCREDPALLARPTECNTRIAGTDGNRTHPLNEKE